MENTINSSEFMKNSISTDTTNVSSYFLGLVPPVLIDTIIEKEKITLIYREKNMLSGNFGPFPDRVYKIEYTCKEGKWHESERIYGTIIPPTPEQYEFEN